MNRRFQRAVLGAFAIFASAALVATSRPAYADEAGADLEVKVSATSATTGQPFRDLDLTVVNNGPSDVPPFWTIDFDFSGLDDSKVIVVPGQSPDCEQSGAKLVCRQPLGLPAGFSHLRTMPFDLEAVQGKEGAAGSFTITAASSAESDPDPENNSATIEVRAVPAEPSTEPTGEPAPAGSAPTAGDGGGLPVTGADVPVTAGFGLALLAVGTGAVLLLRRRARRFEA